MLIRPRAAISWSGGKDSLAAFAAPGLRAVPAPYGWDTYDDAFREALRGLADDGVTHVVFGHRPIAVMHGETVRRGECYALDLVPGRLHQGFGAEDAARG